MVLLLSLACVPTPLTVGTPDDSAAVDSGDSGGQDTDTAEALDYTVWKGHRVFEYEDCEARLDEVGERLPEDWIQYGLLEDYCRDCEHWYMVQVSPERACGFGVTTHTFRGLLLGDSEPAIYWMAEGASDGGLLAEGTWEGHDIVYGYESSGIWLAGRVEFTPLGTED